MKVSLTNLTIYLFSYLSMPLEILRVFAAVFRLQAFDVIGPSVTELTARVSASARLFLERQKADQDVGFRLIDDETGDRAF